MGQFGFSLSRQPSGSPNGHSPDKGMLGAECQTALSRYALKNYSGTEVGFIAIEDSTRWHCVLFGQIPNNRAAVRDAQHSFRSNGFQADPLPNCSPAKRTSGVSLDNRPRQPPCPQHVLVSLLVAEHLRLDQ